VDTVNYKKFTNSLGRLFRNDLNKFVEDVDKDIQNQKERVDNLIRHNMQPSEVVDARGGFPVLNERLDDISEQLASIAKITIEADIDSTSYKKGNKVDVDSLRNIQAQKYALFMRKLRTAQPVSITCQGDSLTYGYDIYSADKREADTTEAPNGTYNTQTRASQTYPEALAEYLTSVYSAGVTTINRGYSGDTADGSYSRWFTKHTGDITILMLGTNDSRNIGDVESYLSWMEQLIIRELLWDKAVVLLTPPKFRQAGEAYGADDVDTFAHALFLLGHKYGIPVVNAREFHANHSYNVYSDAVHFNGEGYKIIGAKVASLFIGEGVANVKRVWQGSTLLTRPMIDNVKYITNASFKSASTTETPDEVAINQGVFAELSAGGSIIYSFYSESDNLIVFPSFLLFSGGTLNITLDFNVQAPQRSLDSTYFESKTQHEQLPMSISYTGVSNYNKGVMMTREDTPLMIVNKGWHTLKVESTGAIAYFYGLELLGFQEYYNIKNIKALEQSTNKNLGSIKEIQLYGGAVSTGTVTLSEDITSFKHLLVVTGSPTDGTLQTGICRGFNTADFRVGTDYIRVPTAGGYFLAQVTGTHEITIQNADNNLRYIYGLNEFVL
jgi:lysophospholipase L1-like esterase